MDHIFVYPGPTRPSQPHSCSGRIAEKLVYLSPGAPLALSMPPQPPPFPSLFFPSLTPKPKPVPIHPNPSKFAACARSIYSSFCHPAPHPLRSLHRLTRSIINPTVCYSGFLSRSANRSERLQSNRTSFQLSYSPSQAASQPELLGSFPRANLNPALRDQVSATSKEQPPLPITSKVTGTQLKRVNLVIP